MRRLLPVSLAVTAALVLGPAPAVLGSEPRAEQGGRIYTASGNAQGGIIMMNVSAQQVINLTPNTFGNDTANPATRYKSEQPSVASNGRMAFASNRTGAWRIYVANADGGNVRRLTHGDASVPDDQNPVISPDGSMVAFLSKRPAEAGAPPSNMRDIWVVRTDGSDLRRVTAPEQDATNWSYIRAVDWNDTGDRLAFRGTRLVAQDATAYLRDVLGFIDPDGTDESRIRVDDCGGGGVLDWVGGSVLYSIGGNVQGCFAAKYAIRDVASGAVTDLAITTPSGLSTTAGAARLSADERHVVFTYALPYYEAALARIGTDGSGRTEARTKAIVPGIWLWWDARSFPRPTSFKATPATVRVTAGKSAQVNVVLRDRRGNPISRSGNDWTWVSYMPGGAISVNGRLTTSPTTPPGTYRARIGNAGLIAEVTIVVRA